VPYPNTDAVYSTEATLFTYSRYRNFVLIGRYRPGEPANVRVDNQAVIEVSEDAFAQQVNKSNSSADLPRTTIESTSPIDVAHLTISYFPVSPRLAAFDISYGQGFYGLEKNETAHSYWSWSYGDADICIWNQSNREVDTCLKLELMTFTAPRTVTISSGAMQQTVALRAEAHVALTSFPVSLQPGQNKIHFHTDRPAQLVGNGDPRPIAFGVQNAVICNPHEGPH
jgi:hypothetical protein